MSLLTTRFFPRSRRPCVRTEPRAAGREIKVPLTPLALWRICAWFGLITGLLELALRLTLKHVNPEVTTEWLWTNRHFHWMVPASDMMIFGTLGLLFSAGVRFGLRRIPRLAAYLLCWLAFLTLLLTIAGLDPRACVLLAGGLAVQAVSLFKGQIRNIAILARSSFPLLLGLLALGSGLEFARLTLAEQQALTRRPAALPGTPNVLLIVLDTVRAESLSLYGSGRSTTPHLEQWARRGVLFEHARSTAPWTLPSHASMFTGRWPHELSVDFHRPLDATYPTLAEFLGGHGYSTAGFVANTGYCNTQYGLARGFAHYEDCYENTVVLPREILHSSELGRYVLKATGAKGITSRSAYNYRKQAASVNRDVLDWFSQHGERPFFVFLNYMDAHSPYRLPKRYSRRFLAHHKLDSITAAYATVHDLRLRGMDHLTPADLDLLHDAFGLLRDAYEDCIAYLDGQLDRLLGELEHRGLLRNTLVIITADHGDHLGEHELLDHAVSLYRPLVHVPLLVLFPPGVPSGRKIHEPVSLRDLPATVADLVGLKDRAPFPGSSLARCWKSSLPAGGQESGPVLSELSRRLVPSLGPGRAPTFQGTMQALVDEGKAYIHNGDGSEELYDLEHDPAEARNLAGLADSRPILERFRSTLERVR